MATKKCMRSGQCCSGMFGVVPKNLDSDISPQFLDSLSDEIVFEYINNNAEQMGKPCKWLTRDEMTTEATCKAQERKGSHCLDYPGAIRENVWCPVGMAYWRDRQQQGLPIPAWVDDVLTKQLPKIS